MARRLVSSVLRNFSASVPHAWIGYLAQAAAGGSLNGLVRARACARRVRIGVADQVGQEKSGHLARVACKPMPLR